MAITNNEEVCVSGDELKQDPVRVIRLAQEVGHVVILDSDGTPSGVIGRFAELSTFDD